MEKSAEKAPRKVFKSCWNSRLRKSKSKGTLATFSYPFGIFTTHGQRFERTVGFGRVRVGIQPIYNLVIAYDTVGKSVNNFQVISCQHRILFQKVGSWVGCWVGGWGGWYATHEYMHVVSSQHIRKYECVLTQYASYLHAARVDVVYSKKCSGHNYGTILRN